MELIIPDATIFPLWVIFIMSALVLHRFVFKPTLQILAEREKQTEGREKDIKYFQEQTEIKFKEYHALMADANNLARNARDGVLKSAEAVQKEIILEARDEAEKYQSKIQTQINQEASQARASLKQDADQMAQQIADKLLERKVA